MGSLGSRYACGLCRNLRKIVLIFSVFESILEHLLSQTHVVNQPALSLRNAEMLRALTENEGRGLKTEAKC